VDLSLITPVYNEQENLPLLFDAVNKTMQPLKFKWEIIFVDDGSRDNSFSILSEMARKDPRHVRVVSFRRNFGQTAAIAAGIDYAEGDVIVLFDADLQNDPADIPLLLGKLDEGYDLVSGWRKYRQDNAFTRNLPSHVANWLISQVTGVHLHDYGCTLKAYRRDSLEGFRLYGEMHRFIPVYANSVERGSLRSRLTIIRADLEGPNTESNGLLKLSSICSQLNFWSVMAQSPSTFLAAPGCC